MDSLTHDPGQWQHLFEPFGVSVPRVIKPPEALGSADDSSAAAFSPSAPASTYADVPASHKYTYSRVGSGGAVHLMS